MSPTLVAILTRQGLNDNGEAQQERYSIDKSYVNGNTTALQPDRGSGVQSFTSIVGSSKCSEPQPEMLLCCLNCIA